MSAVPGYLNSTLFMLPANVWHLLIDISYSSFQKCQNTHKHTHARTRVHIDTHTKCLVMPIPFICYWPISARFQKVRAKPMGKCEVLPVLHDAPLRRNFMNTSDQQTTFYWANMPTDHWSTSEFLINFRTEVLLTSGSLLQPVPTLEYWPEYPRTCQNMSRKMTKVLTKH